MEQIRDSFLLLATIVGLFVAPAVSIWSLAFVGEKTRNSDRECISSSVAAMLYKTILRMRLVLAASPVLWACAESAPGAWQKPGAGNATITKDRSECRAIAEEEAVRRYPYGFTSPSFGAAGMVMSQQRDENQSIYHRGCVVQLLSAGPGTPARKRRSMNAAKYAATERLRNGESLQIRALLPSDRSEMLASIGRASKETLYRRFFAPKRSFSEREIEYFLNVDFNNHVALAAVVSEGGRQVIVGGARYIVSRPGCAEVAFAIDDPHQKWGIATYLIRHLIEIARAAALEEFVAEVLPENAPMLKVFKRCGLAMTTRRERGIVHVTLALSRDAKR